MIAKLAILLGAVASASAAATPTNTASNPFQTLNFGFHWIRNVQSDTYLQGNPPRTVGTALLGSGDTAGQFNIVSGGLIQLTSRSPSYTYSVIDSKTGAMTFVNGDVAPASAGKYSWTALDRELNWTGPDGTVYTSFMLCANQIYAPLEGLKFDADCEEMTLSSLDTLDPLRK